MDSHPVVAADQQNSWDDSGLVDPSPPAALRNAYSDFMSWKEISAALARRLPTTNEGQGEILAKAYLAGVEAQALARTTGTGPVPTQLGTERAELLAYV